MRLSEAIRLGAMLHPQTFGAMCVAKLSGEIVSTCALGAARSAGLTKSELDRLMGVQSWYPCPASVGHCNSRRLTTIVVHLNDDHRWTREQIADWVATVEPADEPHAQPETLAAVDPGVQSLPESLRA
jgi:hypothetical protein